VAFENVLAGRGGEVPDADGVVVGGADGVRAVGVIGDAAHAFGVALEDLLAGRGGEVPDADGAVVGGADGVRAVGVIRDGVHLVGVAEGDRSHGLLGRPRNLRGRVAGSRRGRRLAREHELVDLLVTACAPVDREERGQRRARFRVVQAQWDEATLAVRGVAEAERLALRRRPVRAERVLGHAEHEHRGALEALVDPAWNEVV
jgi:hypothetical protein